MNGVSTTNGSKKINREATERQTRLEVALNNAKREGDKDPTRKAYEALAEHYTAKGDFNNALTKYLDTRDTNTDSLDTCLNIIKTSISIGSMADVKTQANRAQQLHQQQMTKEKAAMINASMGLYNLKVGNYRGAAESFMRCTVDIGDKYGDVITSRDIAVYGSICALSSYGRSALKEEVLNNQNFKQFLELVPTWRKLIHDYQSSKYAACLSALEKMRNDLLLDYYLAPHISKLIAKLFNQSLQQYFKPFTSVKMDSMAIAFGMDLGALEKQLVQLIADGKIAARIDSNAKVLYARHSDERAATFEQALTLGNKYVRDTKSLLLRMSLVEHDFVVRQPMGRLRRDRDDDGKKD